MSAVDTRELPPAGPSDSALWFGLLGPAAAWALQLVVCTIVTTDTCNRGHSAAARIAGGVVTIVSLVVAVAGGLVAAAAWRSTRSESLPRTDAPGREEMMALGGVALGSVFTLGLIWAGLVFLLMSNLCGVVR